MEQTDVETNGVQGLVRNLWRFTHKSSNARVLFSTFVIFVTMVIVLGVASPTFLTQRNLQNILTQSSIYLIMGVGMTLVMTTGGIDISIGSVVGVVTVILGIVMVGFEVPMVVGVLMGIAVASLCGFFNALFIVKFQVPPIIVTLGSMTMFRGVAYLIGGGTIYYNFPESFLWFARGNVLGIPAPIVISFATFIAGYLVLEKTKAGRYITAIGGNEEAARLAGINIGLVRGLVYVVMGALTGLATLIVTARLDAAQAVTGASMEIHTIAVVVIGGTSLFGGRGLMLGTLIGVMILAVLENGLLLVGFSFYWQRVLLGLIFILVVAFRSFRQVGGSKN